MKDRGNNLKENGTAWCRVLFVDRNILLYYTGLCWVESCKF